MSKLTPEAIADALQNLSEVHSVSPTLMANIATAIAALEAVQKARPKLKTLWAMYGNVLHGDDEGPFFLLAEIVEDFGILLGESALEGESEGT